MANSQIMNIPEELKALPQWHVWKSVNGTKVPFQVNGQPAKANDPDTWTTYDEASAAASDFTGLAFSLGDGGVVGIDLDNCLDDTGVAEWAQEILTRFEGVAYAEVSPSGCGIKLVTLGRKPAGVRCVHKFGGPKEQLEVYGSNRFFTITGETWQHQNAVGDGQAAVNWLCDKYLTPAPVVPTVTMAVAIDTPLLERGAMYVDSAGPAVEGGRNNAAFRLAGHLWSLVGEHGARLSLDDVTDFVRTWNDRNFSPLPDSEIVQVVNSAQKNGTARAEKPHGEIEVIDTSVAESYLAGLDADTSKAKTKLTLEQTEYHPPPIEELPEVMRGYIESVSQAVGCDPAFVLLPLLTVCAGAIGNSRRIQMKKGWRVPPIIWSVMIGESGTQKSPPLRAVSAPLNTRKGRDF